MKARTLLRSLLAAALVAASPSSWSTFDPVNDDTDIFLANPSFNATRPNVLIFVDNTANWNTPFDTEKAALASVVTGLNDSYNVGLAMFVETGSPNDNVDGAYVRFGIRQMTATNKARLASLVTAFDKLGDKGNNATASLAMGEMYRYYAGVASSSGFGKAKRDYAGNSTNNSYAYDLAGNPFSSAAATTYTSPIVDGCQKNFIIFISNGPFSDNSSSLATAQTHLSSLTGVSPPTTISISPNGSQGNWADEYAQFMANSDCNGSFDGSQNVYTYTIEVLPGTTGQGPAQTALLKSMAAVGKGKYYAVTDASSTTQLTTALNAIFSEVQAVNSVFASTTLPVSVNVRGTNLNQVYIGVFRPDSAKAPRWLGNLKLYKLGVNSATQTLFLADATGTAAENASTGFITGSAKSYWTAASTYWGYRDSSLNGQGGTSDSPDGDLVEKGGAAQRLRTVYPTSQSTRKLYTCLSGSSLCASGASLSASAFATTNTDLTAADLGAFISYTPTSISSSGTTATIQLAAAPSPTWSTGNQIKVSGASVSNYNGTFTLTSANNTTFQYTYTMTSAPDSTIARATKTNHGFNSGDLIWIYGVSPSGYNTTWSTVSRLDANNFQYTLSSAVSSAADTSGGGYYRVLPITSLTGAAGATTATAVVPNHGLGAAGTTLTGGSYYVYNTPGTWFLNNQSFMMCCSGSITIVDANTITYSPNWSGAISGSASTAKVTTTSAHRFSTGMTITLSGADQSNYNGSYTITKVSDTVFTYTPTSPAPSAASANSGIVASLGITSIARPTTGGSGNGSSCGARDLFRVTTSTTHGFLNGDVVIISNTAGVPGGSPSGFNGTWSISNVSATTFDVDGNTGQTDPNRCLIDSSAASSATGMRAGRAVTRIDAVVEETTPTKWLYVYGGSTSTLSISALNSAAGTLNVGRTVDGDSTARSNIINWVRGADNAENENTATDASSPNDVRPSVHNDVLHSRPAVINYNRYGDDNDIYAYYGSNDGIFHAVKGGLASSETGINPGDERWGFIPKEFFSKLKRLRDNSPTISNVNQKDYFADGSIGIYQKDANNDGKLVAADGDKVYLYVSMRRGGDFIYALDVSDPAAPKLLWRKGNGDTGWGAVGMTWSEPKIAKLISTTSIPNATNNPDRVVLIFGGGYDDTVEDYNPCLLDEVHPSKVKAKNVGSGTVTYTAAGSCTISGGPGGNTDVNRTKGRGILVVDAMDGSVIFQAGVSPTGAYKNLTVTDMTCAFPSDVTLLDKNRDGIVDRIYAGDTCGQMWRVDVANASIDEWTVTKVAAISSTTVTDVANKRKFLFPPDLVFGSDSVGNYTAVLLGSGDREHPFDTTVVNRFYMFKDRDSSDPGNPQYGATNATSVKISGFSTTPTGAAITDSDLFDASNSVVDGSVASSQKGWKVTLAGGEKVISSAVTLSGTTFFNTNQPSSTAGGGACGSNLGIARQYQVSYSDASATTDQNASGGITIADRSTIHAGGGYLPSPVPVVVEIDGKKYQAVISGTSVQTPPGITLDARTRIYWYREVE